MSEEEWPANVVDEPDWYALERENQEGSSQLSASKSAGPFLGASGLFRRHAMEEASRGPATAVRPPWQPRVCRQRGIHLRLSPQRVRNGRAPTWNRQDRGVCP